MRGVPGAAGNLWICGQRKRVDHIPTGPSSTAKKGFNRIGKGAITSFLPRTGRGDWNWRESLLTHPDSCPGNGDHLTASILGAAVLQIVGHLGNSFFNDGRQRLAGKLVAAISRAD